MLQTSQIRAARALLGWRQDQLAKAAKIGVATIARIEQGEGTVAAHTSTLEKIQNALEAKGITFVDDAEAGYGVLLKK